MNRLKVSFLLLWSGLIVLEGLSTKELLECRANLTAAIRNDTIFLKKVHQAEYIFTGKMKELRKGQLHVRVKRAIKGALNGTLELALNDTCSLYIRRSYTGIFMARHEHGLGESRRSDKIVMHFGPVPLTLANLDRLNAAVRGVAYFRAPLTQSPCPGYNWWTLRIEFCMPPGQSHKIPSVTAFNYESPYRAHEFAIARAYSEAARATERKELRAKFSRSQPLKLHLVGSARIGRPALDWCRGGCCDGATRADVIRTTKKDVSDGSHGNWRFIKPRQDADLLTVLTALLEDTT
ncbi:hypothetical protein HZH68_006482 [Vespula germanica]|uniref:Uncharacterized protein n=1 Tax=Vespula germanica TaxID=30212 RepID=A0A834KBJ7_VESGE|nr:hypothetical protein HZH68_006482 [Vespula germanica]